MKISAKLFKTKCLELIDRVEKNHIEIEIIKDGKPIAKLVPIETENNRPLFGYMKGSVVIKGDIVAPLNVDFFENI